MKLRLWARVGCDKCLNDEDFEMTFKDDQESLMAVASACGWGVYNNKQLCPKCEAQK